jgi:hypothetical protein
MRILAVFLPHNLSNGPANITKTTVVYDTCQLVLGRLTKQLATNFILVTERHLQVDIQAALDSAADRPPGSRPR